MLQNSTELSLNKHSVRQPTVLITLRDFSTVRNILTADSVNYLTTSGIKFIILCDDPNDPFLREHLSHPCFVFEKLKLDELKTRMRDSRLFEWFRIVRFHTYGNSTLQSLGTRRYYTIVFKQEIMSKASFPFGKIYFGSVIPAALLASRWKLFRRGLVALEALLFKFSAHNKVYTEHKPTLAIFPSLGYSVADTFLMREARHNGSKLLSIVRSWDNTTNKGYGGCTPDHVFVWNNLMRRETIRHHDVPTKNVDIAGIPHCDVYFQNVTMRERDEFFADHGLRPDRKTIYYAMSGPNSFRNNIDIIELLLQAIHDGRIEHDSQLLVRIHPGFVSYTRKWKDHVDNLKRRLPELEKKFSGRLGISQQSIRTVGKVEILDPINQVLNKELFSFTDVLVNIYSTQMVEASIFDLPIITAGWHPLRETNLPISVFERYDHVRRVLATGAVTTTHTPEELILAINKDLSNRSRLSQERKSLFDQEVSAHRGRAGLYTAERIVSLARSSVNGRVSPKLNK